MNIIFQKWHILIKSYEIHEAVTQPLVSKLS